MKDFSHITRDPNDVRLQPMLSNQVRHHAMLLRAAADLLIAGEPVRWAIGGFGTGYGGVSYLFDAEAFQWASANVRSRVMSGDLEYTIKVVPVPITRYPARKRR